MTNFIPQPLASKVVIIGCCFWYIWIAKDQNLILRAIFGHYNANWLP